MPKDHWRKAADQSVKRRAAAEYARTGGKSSFSYVWEDNDPGPSLDAPSGPKPKKQSKRKSKKPVTALRVSAGAANPARVKARPLTVCPDCKALVNETNLEKHLAKKCPSRKTNHLAPTHVRSSTLAEIVHVSAEHLLHAKSLIVRLEEYLIWEALAANWLNRRGQWVEEICQAKEVASLSCLVAQLESHLSRQYCEAGWRERKSIRLCGNTSSIAELVEELIDFEDKVILKAFQPGWNEDRKYWRSMAQSLYPA